MSSTDSDFADDDENDEVLQAFLSGRTQLPYANNNTAATVINTKTTTLPTNLASVSESVSVSTAAAAAAAVHETGAEGREAGRENERERRIGMGTTFNTIPVPLTSQILQSPLDEQIQAKLFQADGEIATLQAQLLQLQNQKRDELNDLRQAYEALKKSKDAETEALKEAVHKLEDDRKFLKNELITSNALKKRKIDLTQEDGLLATMGTTNGNTTVNASGMAETPPTSVATDVEVIREKVVQKIVRVENDTVVFIDHLRKYIMLGTNRSSFSFLNKICFDSDLDFNFETTSKTQIKKQQAISPVLLEAIMNLRENRLDDMIDKVNTLLMNIIEISIQNDLILPVPFLVSLMHCTLTFKSAAVTEKLIKKLVVWLSDFAAKYVYLLSPDLEEESKIGIHSEKPLQVTALEKFLLIQLVDTLEKAVILASGFGAKFLTSVWKISLMVSLVNTLLPQNTERFKSIAQINTVTSIVGLTASSVAEEGFTFNSVKTETGIVSALIKVLTFDLLVKNGFHFYGLNRILGNNSDMQKIELAVPREHDRLNNYLVTIPPPIRLNLFSQDPQTFGFSHEKYETHLLHLRIQVAHLFLTWIITKQSVSMLRDRDHFKSLFRVIGIHQSYVANNVRSKHVGLRIQLIALLVKVINYITQDLHEASDLIYSETMYEMFVVLLRIAFGADSLSSDAFKLLVKIRSRGLSKLTVFNEWCEMRAREVNHVGLLQKDISGRSLATIESDYANGLEFPYEAETVELARDILNRFVNHEEADNLYFNMNPEYDDIEMKSQ